MSEDISQQIRARYENSVVLVPDPNILASHTRHEWDEYNLRLAFTVATMSRDPTTKVGAILVHRDGRCFSSGYNGFPKGLLETVERWERPEKYRWVIHAERNAQDNANFDVLGATLYCTHRPCFDCLKNLINCRIGRIVYYEQETNLSAAYTELEMKNWRELAACGHLPFDGMVFAQTPRMKEFIQNLVPFYTPEMPSGPHRMVPFTSSNLLEIPDKEGVPK